MNYFPEDHPFHEYNDDLYPMGSLSEPAGLSKNPVYLFKFSEHEGALAELHYEKVTDYNQQKKFNALRGRIYELYYPDGYNFDLGKLYFKAPEDEVDKTLFLMEKALRRLKNKAKTGNTWSDETNEK